MAADPPVVIEDLHKTFRLGFAWTQRIQAVRGLSLSVEPGEVLGFLGPNGAGKTTTLKMLLGLIRPTKGSVRVFGHPAGRAAARRRLGFLPENPYFYAYLTAREFLHLCGGLHGLGRRTMRKRASELLLRVGLSGKEDVPMRKFSKGMLQRAGIAQALMGDPDLVVLDEPQSGLDPIGRKEVRDIIRSLGDEGKTVFFSSHVLADVEAVADRVALMVRGRLRAAGRISELLEEEHVATDVVIRGAVSVPAAIEDEVELVRQDGDRRHFLVSGEEATDALLRAAVEGGQRIVDVSPHRRTLEDLFVAEAQSARTRTGQAS